MIINDAGTYNLVYTATDECGNETVVNRELIVEDMIPIYGAEWDGSNTTRWTRTDDAALFADPSPQYSDGNGGWVGGSSPFDDLMPWSGMEIVEDADAGTLVSIPKFYYKWTRNDNAMKLQISPTAQEGFFTSPAHADRGDGVGERDVVYVGRYHCSINTIKSISGASVDYRETRSSARTKIHNLGNDIWQSDYAMFWTIRMLYLVEYARWGHPLGEGCSPSDVSNRSVAGNTDNMTYHSGTTASVGNWGFIQYRYIEGFYSNIYEWIDGIYINGSDVYAINNPTDFSDDSNGVFVGTKPNSTNVILSFTNPNASGYEYALYPDAVSATGIQDYYWNTSNATVIYTGGSYYYHNTGYCGPFLYGENSSTASEHYIGYRLMKLPS